MTQNAGRRFLGGLLTAAGVLIAALSGLCSFGFVAPLLVSFFNGGQRVDGLVTILLAVGVFGGLPFAAGLTLIILGMRLLRRSKRGAP